ncbi:MAG TPA: hypothetical protein VHG31_00490 [Stellaceae bacterium]|nr:hypothetical protein [Stellaceae bacterium]
MKVREQLFQSDTALLNFYKGQYTDKKIEERLRAVLWRRASDDSDWLRRDIVEAMGEVGSEAALAELEAIAFNLGSTLQARRVLGDDLAAISEDSDDFRENLRRKLPGLEAASRAEFLQAVSAAIAAIKARSR